jgi:hypothetical protein
VPRCRSAPGSGQPPLSFHFQSRTILALFPLMMDGGLTIVSWIRYSWRVPLRAVSHLLRIRTPFPIIPLQPAPLGLLASTLSLTCSKGGGRNLLQALILTRATPTRSSSSCGSRLSPNCSKGTRPCRAAKLRPAPPLASSILLSTRHANPLSLSQLPLRTLVSLCPPSHPTTMFQPGGSPGPKPRRSRAFWDV